MNGTQKSKSCTNYKSIENGFGAFYRNSQAANCKSCVYFSSRNCGMDAADSIEPDLEIFY